MFAVLLLVVSTSSQFAFNFLRAEDSVVLFNRVNYIDLAGIGLFSYYNNYVSVPAQAIAFVLKDLPPLIQAAVYSAVACFLGAGIYFYTVRVTGSVVAGLLGLTVLIEASARLIYNLTYSQWTGLILLYLIGIAHQIERRRMRNAEVALSLILASYSPLSIFSLPIFLYSFFKLRDWRSLVLIVSVPAVVMMITESGGDRMDLSIWLQNATSAFALLFEGIFYESSESVSFGQIFERWAILLLAVAISVLLLSRKATDGLVWLLFFLACLAPTLLAILTPSAGTIEAALPLASRYWIVALFGTVLCLWILCQNVGLLRYGLGLLTAYLAIVSFVGAVDKLMTEAHSGPWIEDLAALWQGHSSTHVIERHGQSAPNQWSVVLGGADLERTECTHQPPEAYLARAYCSSQLGYAYFGVRGD